MEQKTFFAIVLSFLFLISYNALVIAPQQKKISKTVVNNNVTTQNPASSTSISDLTPLQKSDNHPSLKEIQIGDFSLNISDSGGYIQSIYSKAYKYTPPLSGFIYSPQSKPLISHNVNTVTLASRNKDVQVNETYTTVSKNQIDVKVSITPQTSTLDNVLIELFTIDIHQIKHDQTKMRENMLFEYSIASNGKIFRKGNAFKFSSKENKDESTQLDWIGWRDRYHFSVIKTDFKNSGYIINAIDDHKISIMVKLADLNLAQNETKSFNFHIYIGPQDLNLIKNLDADISKIMAFSNYGFLDFIEKLIYKLLLLIHKFIPSWGLCIIFISLFIYGITYPLTLKSMLSMRKMQELQPKMAELREKYKNNPQKLNEEVVTLYRVNNVNPLSGCLPVLLQMPVFISLYQVLWRTYNFQNASFLWIKDLSQPDKLFTFPYSLPFIGNEFNLLPILMIVVMFFQQKLSAKNMVVVDPAQEMQQKMMMFIMPVFIGAIFYHFASGLTLYFTIFYLLSTLSQYKMSKLKKA